MKSKKSRIFKFLVLGANNPQIATQYLPAHSQGVKNKNFPKYPKKLKILGVLPQNKKQGRDPDWKPCVNPLLVLLYA